MKKKIYKRLLFGFLSGAVVGNLIAMLMAAGSHTFYSPMLVERFGSPAAAIIMQTLLSSLIGVAGMGGVSLYDETDLPVAAATAIHFGIVEAVFIPVGLILHWLSRAVEYVVMSAIMLSAFAVIWAIMFILHKKEVDQLNEINLSNKKKEKDR